MDPPHLDLHAEELLDMVRALGDPPAWSGGVPALGGCEFDDEPAASSYDGGSWSCAGASTSPSTGIVC